MEQQTLKTTDQCPSRDELNKLAQYKYCEFMEEPLDLTEEQEYYFLKLEDHTIKCAYCYKEYNEAYLTYFNSKQHGICKQRRKK